MTQVLLFSDMRLRNDRLYFKSSSILRLTYNLRALGFSVKQIHHCLSFSKEQIKHIITSTKPDVIGISTSFLSDNIARIKFQSKIQLDNISIGYHWGNDEIFEKIFAICYYGKQIGSKVLVGGWEVNLNSLMDKDKKKFGFSHLSKFVDCFVVGDGKEIIKNIIKNESIKISSVQDYPVYFSSKIEDYSDQASTPSFSDHIFDGESLSAEIAGGCIFSCSFCDYGSLGKKKYEFMRSFESLERELLSNYERFGTLLYNFTDNIINDYTLKLEMLSKIRQKHMLDIRYVAYTRLDTIRNKDQIKLLKDSGAVSFCMGVESFNKDVGKFIGKMTDKEKLVEKLYMIREVFGDDLNIVVFIINGLPTETIESCEKTFEFLQSKEGKFLIDNYKATTLKIMPDISNKNDINKNRNDPFRDYVQDGFYWKSPWGDYDDFRRITIKQNYINRSKIDSYLSGFFIPPTHNAGIQLKDILRIKRNKENTDGLIDKITLGTLQREQRYQQQVLGTL